MARKYPKLRSCCLAHLKFVASIAAGGVGAAIAEMLPEEGYTEFLLLDPEIAGFLSAAGAVYVSWSLLEFVLWRRRGRRASPDDDSSILEKDPQA